MNAQVIRLPIVTLLLLAETLLEVFPVSATQDRDLCNITFVSLLLAFCDRDLKNQSQSEVISEVVKTVKTSTSVLRTLTQTTPVIITRTNNASTLSEVTIAVVSKDIVWFHK